MASATMFASRSKNCNAQKNKKVNKKTVFEIFFTLYGPAYLNIFQKSFAFVFESKKKSFIAIFSKIYSSL